MNYLIKIDRYCTMKRKHKEKHVQTKKVQRITFSVILTLTLLNIHSSAHAYRPFITEDAGTASSGENKFESGFIMKITDSHIQSTLSFMYGIGLGNAELLIETPYCTNDTSQSENEGIQSTIIGLKLKMLGEHLNSGIITLKSEFSNDANFYCLSIIASKDLSNAIIHTQTGWLYDTELNGIRSGCGIEMPLKTFFSITYEIQFFIIYSEETTVLAALGCIIRPFNNISIDIALGNSSNNSKYSPFITFGIAIILQ